MWKFIKGEKDFNCWHKKNLISYPQTPEKYPCIVIKKIDPDECTSNHVLYGEDVKKMIQSFITYFRGESAIADLVLSWGTPLNLKGEMRVHPFQDLPPGSSETPMPPCKPPLKCRCMIIVNGRCTICQRIVKK